MRFFACAILCACLGSPLSAALSERDALKLRLQYLEIKDDSDLYIGQSAATLKDHADWDKAELAATAGARAALAEAIEVRIQSKVTDSMQGNAQGVTQKTESLTQTESDLKLANVKILALREFPQESTVTVLAYLTKEDYRRQLAGKAVPVYHIERGLRLNVGTRSLPWVDILRRELAVDPFGPNPCSNCDRTPPGPNPADINFGLELQYRGWLLGAEMGQYTVNGWFLLKGGTQTHKLGSTTFGLTAVNFGYEWTPWSWRLQPFFPLKLEAAFINYDAYQNLFWGLVPGAGVRYWITDFISLDLKGSQHLSFGSETRIPSIMDRNIGALGAVNATGSHFEAGLTWSGF